MFSATNKTLINNKRAIVVLLKMLTRKKGIIIVPANNACANVERWK